MDRPTLMPIGFRFHPTDEELVDHYLKHKLLGNDFRVYNVITEIDVYRFEPRDLPAFSKVKSDDKEWFFFSPLGLKFRKDTKNRYNRKTNGGFWKITGKDRKIKTADKKIVIGTKKTLVYYQGRSSHSVKTNWFIHEYHAVTFPEDKRCFVLCRLINKAAEGKPSNHSDSDFANQTEDGVPNLYTLSDEGEPSSHIAADFENQETEDSILNLYTLPEVNLESIFPTPAQEEEYEFPSSQQSSIVIEQEPSSECSLLSNTYFGEENSIMHTPLETIEEENHLDNIYIDKFLNENLDGEECVQWSNETIPASFIEAIPASFIEAIPALKKAYYESRETDSEPLSAQVKTTTPERGGAF